MSSGALVCKPDSVWTDGKSDRRRSHAIDHARVIEPMTEDQPIRVTGTADESSLQQFREGGQIVVDPNREPYSHDYASDGIYVTRPAGSESDESDGGDTIGD